MDGLRLGTGIDLPNRHSWKRPPPAYLTDTDWDALDEDWLEQALAYTAVPCKGVPGPLTRIRPRPARSGSGRPGSSAHAEQLTDGPASTPAGPLYRLADYLDQYGRAHRNSQIPPGRLLGRRGQPCLAR